MQLQETNDKTFMIHTSNKMTRDSGCGGQERTVLGKKGKSVSINEKSKCLSN